MKATIKETKRRREKQIKFNEEHGIVPQQIKKQDKDIIDGVYHEEDASKEIAKLEKAMQQAARDLQFE